MGANCYFQSCCPPGFENRQRSYNDLSNAVQYDPVAQGSLGSLQTGCAWEYLLRHVRAQKRKAIKREAATMGGQLSKRRLWVKTPSTDGPALNWPAQPFDFFGGGPTLPSSNLYPFERSAIAQQYELVKSIGRGSFGTVYLARLKRDNEVFVAIKVVAASSVRDYVDAAEVFTLKSLSGQQGIIQILDAYVSPWYCVYVVEYFDADLDHFTRHLDEMPLNEKAAASIVIQLSEGLAVMHGKGLIHRDIHNKNVLVKYKSSSVTASSVSLQSIKVKLADFGKVTSVENNGHWNRTFTGTNACCALRSRPPECLYAQGTTWATEDITREQCPRPLKTPATCLCSAALDLWGLGCVGAELLLPEGPPFNGKTEADVAFRIAEALGPVPEDVRVDLGWVVPKSLAWRTTSHLRHFAVQKAAFQAATQILSGVLVYFPGARTSAADLAAQCKVHV